MLNPLTTDPGELEGLLSLDRFERVDGLRLTVGEALKHPHNPVLPLGDLHEWDSLHARPWQGRTILFDPTDRLFKCWYDGTDLSTERWWATGYAESRDGVHWVKPKLGIHTYNGNTSNNICLFGWGPIVKDDAESDPKKRFKMLLSTKSFTTSVEGASRPPAIRFAYSSDGIHWTEGREFSLPAWHGERPDVVALICDESDPDTHRRFKLIWQGRVPSNKWGPAKVRAKYLSYAAEFEGPYITAPTAVLDPRESSEHENHFVMLAPYGGGYVMPYEYGWYVPDGTGKYGRYISDIRLAVSLDGERFHRVNTHEPLLRRGPRGTWDDGFLVIADKPVVRDDGIYMFYAGCGEDWTSWMGDNRSPEYRWESTGTVRRSQMGLATLRPDGYTYLAAPDRETPGIAVTAPIRITDRDTTVWLNASDTADRRGWVDVEVLGPSGDSPIDGFAWTDGGRMSHDGTRVAVNWGTRGIGDIPGDVFRLRLRLVGPARLYAFGFESLSLQGRG